MPVISPLEDSFVDVIAKYTPDGGDADSGPTKSVCYRHFSRACRRRGTFLRLAPIQLFNQSQTFF